MKPPASARYPAAWLYYLLTGLAWLACNLLLGSRIRRDPRLAGVRGPLIIISNHPSFIDPLLTALAFFPRRIHFLTTGEFFRGGLAAWILKKLQAIPKVQFRSDLQATKAMFRIIRGGGTLAIYPEGQRSLDGGPSPFDDSIAKFVKKAGCTVAVIRESGAYLSWPRWSQSGPRFGRIETVSRLLLTPEDLAQLTVDVIQLRIERALSFNDYGWQHKRMIPYFSLAPARGLHNLCHQCPACGQMLAMQSDRHSLTCRFCGNKARLDRFGILSADPRDMSRARKLKIKPDPHRWHQWQLMELRKKMNENDFSMSYAATAETIGKDGQRETAHRGTIRLASSELQFDAAENIEGALQPLKIRLPYSSKTGISFDCGRQFELALGEEIFRFKLDNGQAAILIADAFLAAAMSARLDTAES